MNVSETPENTQLIYREQVEMTPFWIVGDIEKGYMVVMGKWRLSTEMATPEIAREYIKQAPYEITLRMIVAVAEDVKEQIKNETIPF